MLQNRMSTPRKVDPEKQERGRITTLATFDVLVLAAKGLAAAATPLEVVYAAFPVHVTFERDARGILRASLAAARESIFPENEKFLRPVKIMFIIDSILVSS
jgi:hypothetical protein